MYFLEWGIWKGRLMPQTEAEKKKVAQRKSGRGGGNGLDLSKLAEEGGAFDKPTGIEPNDAYSLYSFNDRYIDVRGAAQEEKRGLITFAFLMYLGLVSFLLWLGIYMPARDLMLGAEWEIDSLVFFMIFMVALAGLALFLGIKFLRYIFRLEVFTQRHIVVRFNRVTRQVYINRPRYAGGIIILPWEVTAAGIDPNQPDEQMIGMPLLLAWPSELNGAGFDEFAMLGEPMDGNRNVVGLWEFIRRYMQEGPQAVPKPKRLRPLWASPALSLREVLSFLMPMMGRGGGAFSLVWGIVLLPVMVLHFVCHWLSMMLCYRARWPKVIEEAGLPGKPVPKTTVAEDYGPEIGARLREATLESRGIASQPAQKDARATFQS